MRGRRQVGKSRLVEEFADRADASSVFYTAARASSRDELRNFGEQIAASRVQAATVAAGGPLGSWEAALALAVSGASSREPVVLVIDELPFLIESEPAIEAILQKQWDRHLEAQAVLLILIGSDVSMMRALSEYGRPLYGRLTEMAIRPLSPRTIGEMLGLGAADAFDAYMAIGGFPRLAQTWHPGESIWSFLRRQLQDPESPLVVLGERSLAAEFPSELRARATLAAIGSGERTFTTIMDRAGVSGRTLETTLTALAAKQVVEKALPYSARPRPKLSRYFVADPYMRFWLRFLRTSIPLLERGRGENVLRALRAAWPAYAGQAIEPLVRAAIERMLPDERFAKAEFVGGYWNRDNSVEVDLVGGREPTGSAAIDFVGSIKWRARGSFDRRDFARLAAARALVPGAGEDTLLVGVSRNAFAAGELDVALTPADLLTAFQA